MLVTMIDLAVPALIVANGVGLALERFGASRRYTNAAAVLCAIATLVPVGSSSLGGLYLSIFGTPSAATILLTLIFAQRFAGAGPSTPSNAFVASIAVAGLLLYPATAGLTVVDPYDLGFRGWAIPGLMAAIAIGGWLMSARDAVLWTGLAAALFLAGATGSHNIWDALVDPFAWLVALTLGCARLYRVAVRRRFAQAPTVK